jgi:general secretion pathway protein G
MTLLARMNRRLLASGGFSGIELAIVLLILGLVVWVSIPAYQGYMDRAKVLETVVAVGEMSKGIRRFEMAKGALPDSLAEAGYGNSVDAWGYPYEYLNLRNAKGNGQARKDKKLAPLNSDFDLYSIGRDGLTASQLSNQNSRDDVVRARDGAFIGTAEEFDP